MVPTGTQVRVVNQPYLVGWRDHQLYLQVYPPLQDDKRDWQHAQHRLLNAMLSTRLRHDLATEGAVIDWQSVAALGTAARGVPVPITGAGASAGVDAVLAAAPRVQNRIPLGADWDGADDASADDKSPQQVLSDLEPAAAGGTTSTATAAAPAASAPAPRPAQAAAITQTGANGG
jgi:L,D-transpeptidase ErfK/SrfK